MGDKFNDWLEHEAEWWQFWYPQSGAVGGSIFGVFFVLFTLGLVGFLHGIH